MEETAALGQVTCPSGELVLMDGGYLDLWSGDRSPDDDDARDDSGPAADFEVVGADADAAARSFDRQSGRMLYDIPEHGTAEFAELFDEHCRTRGLNAALHRSARRVPHRDRVRRATTVGDPDFLITGVSVVPVGEVPIDRPLPVTAVGGQWGWREIRIGFREDTAVATRPLGEIGVDFARFVFADADALGSWDHHRPLDGLADVVFWGRDAAAIAAGPTDTPGEDVQGWLNLPVRDAYARALALDHRRQADPPRMFAFDFRPHSHHWQVMADVRASDHEAAGIEVGGARLMMAMTSVGDGFFPVHLDVDAAGVPVAVRITVTGDDD
ncbi:hypothetical protein AB0J80_27225 [Actinoplanes sp. NPDC049548]|uniref:hypothetical protein n=1 Tax=Actinoplanes sp. NPDC049548 TaxID=3155152 RepID=UPI00343743AB